MFTERALEGRAVLLEHILATLSRADESRLCVAEAAGADVKTAELLWALPKESSG